jgi:hypothetical protein
MIRNTSADIDFNIAFNDHDTPDLQHCSDG